MPSSKQSSLLCLLLFCLLGLLFFPEDGVIAFLVNAGKVVRDYTLHDQCCKDLTCYDGRDVGLCLLLHEV
jgi:hypothetical protein